MSDAQPNLLLQVGGAVNPRRSVYVVRSTDDELLRQLEQGEYCNVLCSRQMGKTSLIKRTMVRLLGQGTRTAYVEVAGYLGRIDDANEWYIYLLQEIADQLGIQMILRDWWQKHQTSAPSLRLIRFFRDGVAAKAAAPIVIFLDEIDSTLKYRHADDFFLAIRAMYSDRASDQVLDKITFCLIGVTTPNQLIKVQTDTPYNLGEKIELQDFDFERDDLNSLFRVMSNDPNDLAEGKAIVQSVINWTGGHPFLTLRVCKEFLKKRYSSPSDVDSLVSLLFTGFEELQNDIHFEPVLRFLSERADDKLAALGLYRRILKGEEVRDQDTPSHIALELAGIVKRSKRGMLIVRNPIYQRVFNDEWAATLAKTDAKSKEVAAFKVTANKDEETLRFALEDYKAALDAHARLSKNPAHVGDADELLAQFFERHADLAKRDGHHHEALLWRLKALMAAKTRERAASLAELIGSEFAQRAMIARSQHQSSERGINGIKFIDLSQDGQQLLTVGDNPTLHLLLADSKRLLWQEVPRSDWANDRVCSAALRSDGLRVLIGVEDSVALLWRTDYVPPADNPKVKQTPIQLGDRDSKTGKRVGKVGAVAFSPDGQTAITGSDDGAARLWAVESGRPLAQPMRHKEAIISAGFSPTGKIAFTTSADGTLCLWQADSGKLLCQPIRHQGIVWASAFSPDERTILTGCDDGEARLWSLDSGKRLGRPMRHGAWVSSVAFSADGQMVLTGSADGTMRLWRADSGQAIDEAIRYDDGVKAVAFSPDRKTILAVTSSWVHAAHFDGKKALPLANSFLLGLKVWSNEIRIEDTSANRVKLVAGLFPDSLRVLTLQFDQPDAALLQGDPEAALIEWQNILGLRISESGKIEPLYSQAAPKQTRTGGITVTDPTGRTFISYRRTRVDEIALLIAALHDRGVPTWQDLSNLGMGQAEEGLRKVLADPVVSSGILWLTPDVADSAMIRKVEMPELLNRARNDEAFFALLVAAGKLDYNGVAELGKGYVPYDLGEFNISKVTGDPIDHLEAAKVARLVLRQRIAKLHRRLPADEPLVVNIYTGTPPPFQAGKALTIDWTQRFVGGRTALPGAWEDFLLPALKDIVEAIQTQAPERAVEITGLLSLPGAVALGCMFLEPRGIKISWRPRQSPNQFWNIKEPRQTSGFVSTLIPDLLNGEDLAVLVSVDNKVSPAFTRSKDHLRVKFRAISEVVNPGLAPGVTRYEINTPSEAADIAFIVRQAIITARNQHSEIKRTHLFMAVPVGLAMMIGQLMSTCGDIQTYEFKADDPECPYQPTVLLKPTW